MYRLSALFSALTLERCMECISGGGRSSGSPRLQPLPGLVVNQWLMAASDNAAHSSGTVRDSHPIPSWLPLGQTADASAKVVLFLLISNFFC